MTTLPITLTIAGAAALLNVWLGLRVSLLRRRLKVSIGDGGNPAIATRMRAHANFIEYAPFFLILLGLIEMARGSETWLWLVAILFIAGRLAHPFGMDRTGGNALRVVGIVLTWACLLVLAAYALALPYLDRAPTPGVTYAAAPYPAERS
ncbi:MAG TPA: MAPEG family protein [Allosphingosinicella sp.]|nr:MAPEG family protein [Allosphingosinicella sp.]